MKKHSGFTLVELLITLIIVSILLAIGLPSLKSFLQGNQLVAGTNELLSAIHIARSEAIKLQTSVTICGSTNGTSCTDPATNNWEDGWIVFVDSDSNLTGTGAACAAVNTDCLLRSHGAFTDTRFIVEGVDPGGVDINSITFNSRGLPRSAAGAWLSGAFSLCSLDGSGNTIGARAVVLDLSGRVRVSDNAAVISCP